MTFYLKYRPQTISALDLASARRELQAILDSGRFSHAYLFAGPRGTGKTSAARILAKVVNCVSNQGAIGKKAKRLHEPCNKCVSCTAISSGRALDLFEIDAASNRGIDDVRELRERIKLAPTHSRFKVYIIDEVHMLTTEAFNALLKTLEEPPEHALFVLCTTVPEKLPDTIVSRCTRITFRKANPNELVHSLEKVVKGEGLEVDTGVLEAIATRVDGSFRDGMKILEQLSLRTSGKGRGRRSISLEDVAEVVGLSEADGARKLLSLMASGNHREAFRLLAEVDNRQSVDLFLRQILELLHRLLLSQVGVEEEEGVEGLDLAATKALIGLFSRAAGEMPTAVLSVLPLEIAVAEWMQYLKSSKSQPAGISGREEASGTQKPQAAPVQMTGAKNKVKFSRVLKGWPKVLEHLRPQNHSLEALLKAASPKAVEGEVLVVEVAYPFHKQQLELLRYRSLVESAIAEVLSARVSLRYVLGELSPKLAGERKHENITPVEDEDLLRAAEEIFGKGEE